LIPGLLHLEVGIDVSAVDYASDVVPGRLIALQSAHSCRMRSRASARNPDSDILNPIGRHRWL
jgi:hypothetical protein